MVGVLCTRSEGSSPYAQGVAVQGTCEPFHFYINHAQQAKPMKPKILKRYCITTNNYVPYGKQ